MNGQTKKRRSRSVSLLPLLHGTSVRRFIATVFTLALSAQASAGEHARFRERNGKLEPPEVAIDHSQDYVWPGDYMALLPGRDGLFVSLARLLEIDGPDRAGASPPSDIPARESSFMWDRIDGRSSWRR